jgi:peroxiredoxin
MLGEAAEDRARQLASLEALDFTLPDIEGVLHSLSDFRGKKVLLATWASW